MGTGTLPAKVAAVLFDMDDTLVDSERAWFAATDELWRESGGNPEGKGILGGTVGQLVTAYVNDFPAADAPEVDRRLRELLSSTIATGVSPMPGSQTLIARLSAYLPIAVASNSPSTVVRQVIDSLGWDEAFTAVLGAEDVEHSKPAPDLYLAAARACGARIEDCVIFEDSPMGCAAALASGAFVVSVGPAAAGAGDLTVGSLEDERVTTWHPEVIV